MKKFRVGIVQYLNAKPLIQPLLEGELEHNLELRLAPPSQLARELKLGKLDVGLIPAIEYASNPDYLILPELAISACGAVHSVLLYSKKPVSEIKTVALDIASRTSVALVKILFAQHFKSSPKYIEATPPLDQMFEVADAALIIGDTALQTPAEECYQLDLSEEWFKLTGQAFVFAIFVARKREGLEKVWQTLLKSREIGMKNISQIARQESSVLGLDYETCFDYLTHRICYDLSPEKLTGLKSFFKFAEANNLIGKDVKLRFFQQTKNIPPLLTKLRQANA